jgi:hypothetical protein
MNIMHQHRDVAYFGKTGHIQTFRDRCHGQFKALHDVEISALDTAAAIRAADAERIDGVESGESAAK